MPRFEASGHGRRGRTGVTYDLLGGEEVVSLLDYGCGEGDFALGLAEEFDFTVHACDIDGERISALDRASGARVNFFAVPDGSSRLPLADGALSTVTCCDVLEHVPAGQRPQVLGEMRRVLRPGGALVLTVPHRGLFAFADPENFKFLFPGLHRAVYRLARGRESYARAYEGQGRFGNYSSGQDRHTHFGRAELEELLGAAGFSVEEVRYFRLFHPLIRVALWLAEGFAGRVAGAERLRGLCWKAYRWDSGLEPGPLAYDIAIRARARGAAGSEGGPAFIRCAAE